MAIRPKTLSASICPVLIGTAMAFGDGPYHLPTAILCLLGALSIQIGTNLANDYFDFKNGADNNERIGPTRVTQAGLISPKAMIIATAIAFSVSAIICYLLVLRGGWPIATIGIFSILSGLLYTAGPKPLGYMGLGDIFVFVFFGPVAVAGTYYVQTFEINLAVIAAGIAPGLIATAILAINNLRDIDSDRKSGKNTLAVRFGRSFAISEYLFCILAASLMPVLIYTITDDHVQILVAVITCLIAIPTIKTVASKIDGPSLNKALASTGQLLLIYSILFSIGWIWKL